LALIHRWRHRSFGTAQPFVRVQQVFDLVWGQIQEANESSRYAGFLRHIGSGSEI
jgi:hypothetical protein